MQRGYKKVGKDFPVFLHPDTNDEYALARTEYKHGLGHTGFTTNTNNVTLEEDLLRRDLTINAIAQACDDAQLIDPYGGRSDLKNKILRHVSPAFSEDPLRVLRVARFVAQLDFSVASETITLMQEIVDSGEMKSLTTERIWREIEKALNGRSSYQFFEILETVGALREIMPEINRKHIHLLSKCISTAKPISKVCSINDGNES